MVWRALSYQRSGSRTVRMTFASGYCLEQLAIERAAGPVDGRPVAGEEPVPIDRLAARGGIPGPRVFLRANTSIMW